jgi:hypothetical protein
MTKLHELIFALEDIEKSLFKWKDEHGCGERLTGDYCTGCKFEKICRAYGTAKKALNGT